MYSHRLEGAGHEDKELVRQHKPGCAGWEDCDCFYSSISNERLALLEEAVGLLREALPRVDICTGPLALELHGRMMQFLAKLDATKQEPTK